MGLPSYRDLEDGGVEAAEYRVWVRAPNHVRPVEGIDYDQFPTEHPRPGESRTPGPGVIYRSTRSADERGVHLVRQRTRRLVREHAHDAPSEAAWAAS